VGIRDDLNNDTEKDSEVIRVLNENNSVVPPATMQWTPDHPPSNREESSDEANSESKTPTKKERKRAAGASGRREGSEGRKEVSIEIPQIW